jgi:hypothetical protein
MQGGGADASEAGEDVVIELGGMMEGQTMLEEQYSESRALSVQDIERSVRYSFPLRTLPRAVVLVWWSGGLAGSTFDATQQPQPRSSKRQPNSLLHTTPFLLAS